MGEPFLSEIRMMGFDYAPRGWAKCDGSLLPVSQNQALFSLFGYLYGGSEPSTFALPDLRGRVPVGIGQLYDAYPQGRAGGLESVTLQQPNIPEHAHALQASTDDATASSPENTVLAKPATGTDLYGAADNLVGLGALSVGSSPPAQNQGHNNVQPTQVINFCIATTGAYPSRD